jgi:hypothetical protein
VSCTTLVAAVASADSSCGSLSGRAVTDSPLLSRSGPAGDRSPPRTSSRVAAHSARMTIPPLFPGALRRQSRAGDGRNDRRSKFRRVPGVRSEASAWVCIAPASASRRSRAAGTTVGRPRSSKRISLAPSNCPARRDLNAPATTHPLRRSNGQLPRRASTGTAPDVRIAPPNRNGVIDSEILLDCGKSGRLA